MNKSDLKFEFPEDLIAIEPQRPSRICSTLLDSENNEQTTMLAQSNQALINSTPTNSAHTVYSAHPAQEVTWNEFLSFFQSGDVLVLNNTKVLKRRIWTKDGLEILFLESTDQCLWSVLFPAKRFKVGDQIQLPGEINLTLLEKGRPQKVKTSQVLSESYFDIYGELPLPPYIQKARDQRHTQDSDESWYQTQWSEKPGSFAAPTASLHFTQEHLRQLKSRGVQICYLTLHVGLGTFLPVEVENLQEHIMHKEFVEISQSVLSEISKAQSTNHRVWAMGTTVMRALESYGAGYLKQDVKNSVWIGNTDLLILPGFQFKMVDRLLTNFHQPESTLLALVMAFAGIEKVKATYQWAINNKFKLFSYGDLSVWERKR